ncbi:MAG: hypothetical protein AAF502_20165 [Bacteroidota bacterium]
MRRLFPFLLVLVSSLMFWFTSCEEVTTQLDIDFGYEYFPQETGKFIIYEADSVIYDQSGNSTVIDTISFQVLERFMESFEDNSGQTVYRIERYERPTENDSWRPKDVWTSQINDLKAERVEENLRFIKLIFPAGPETDPWNGNVFLDETTVIPIAGESVVVFKNWLYEYVSKDEPYDINGMSFDSTLNVLQANEENLIELRYSQEIYAKGVGLIYKEMKILDTQCISLCEGQAWEQKAEKGFTFTMRVIEHNW